MGFEYSENRVGALAGYEDVKSTQNTRDTAAMFDARRGVDNALNEMRANAQPQPEVQAYTQPVESAPAQQYSPDQQQGISNIIINAADWISFARADVTGRRAG